MENEHTPNPWTRVHINNFEETEAMAEGRRLHADIMTSDGRTYDMKTVKSRELDLGPKQKKLPKIYVTDILAVAALFVIVYFILAVGMSA